MFNKRSFVLVGAASFVFLAAGINGQDKGKPDKVEAPKLPDGVIHVQLPPGELRMENIVRKGKFLIRLTVDKTVIEARTIFLGDTKGATHFEATKDGIHWVPASGGKGFLFGNGGASIREPGSTLGDPDFYALDKLKAGSVFLTTPSVRFVFGSAAKPRLTGREGAEEAKAKEQDGPNLPDGIVHVAMPPGTVRMENLKRHGKPFLRASVDRTVVEARSFYKGDLKGAVQYEAVEEGMHRMAANGEQGFVIDGVWNSGPGSESNQEDFVTIGKLRQGA